jgi:hypothetical protein
LFGLIFLGIALATYATSFYVILHYFVVGFEPSQQVLLVIVDVNGGVELDLQRSFLSSPYKHDIDNLFF